MKHDCERRRRGRVHQNLQGGVKVQDGVTVRVAVWQALSASAATEMSIFSRGPTRVYTKSTDAKSVH